MCFLMIASSHAIQINLYHKFKINLYHKFVLGKGVHVFPDGCKLSCSWKRGCPVGAGMLCLKFLLYVYLYIYVYVYV
jgi:hypothetical protein